MSVPDPPGVFAPHYRALTVGILLSITAVAIEGMAVATIMPSVAQELGGIEAYGWAFSAFMLTSLLGAISAGQTADRHHVSMPARIGFVAFSLGLVGASVATAWPLLLVARAVQGFGAGCLGAVAYVAVARGYPEALRPRLLAMLASAWIMPALIGPAIAGQIAEHLSWRVVFIGIVPAVAVGAWMLLPSLSQLSGGVGSDNVEASAPLAGSAGGRAESSRLPAAVRLTVGVAVVLLAASLPVAAWVAVSVGLLGVVLAAPALRVLLPDGAFTGKNGGPAAVAVRGLLAFGFFGAEALIPLGLSTQRGLPASLVGLSLTAGALAWVSGSWLQEHAEAASNGSVIQRAIRAAGGLVLITAGIVGVAATIATPGLPVELAIVAWAVGGLGMGVAYPAGTLTALGSAEEGQEGTAASSLQVAETLGIATGTGAAGALVAMSVHLEHGMADGLQWGFILSAAAIAITIPLALRMAPSLPWPARWRPTPTP